MPYRSIVNVLTTPFRIFNALLRLIGASIEAILSVRYAFRKGVWRMAKLRLKELRSKMKLTQADVSVRLQITRGTYSRYETGEREMTYDALISLAELFDVSVDYLLGRYDSNPVLLNDMESIMLHKFRELDERGKKSIQAMIEFEHSPKK